MSELSKSSVFVSAAGGILEAVRDGEVIASIAIPAGRISVWQYLDLFPHDAELRLSEGLTVLNPRSWAGRQAYGAGSHESGANPDFQVTSASRFEREMRVTMAKMQADQRRILARERALAQVERIPQNPSAASVELIEPVEKSSVE